MTETDGARRPPTLVDVAARAGVSRALVSIVMREVPGASDATRRRVLAVAAELGYRPDARARLLAGRRTQLLGVTLALHNPFHADLAEGVYAAAERRGYQVVLSAITPARSAQQAVDTLLAYRCDGALLLGALVPDEDLDLLTRQVPVVVVGQPAPKVAAGVVRVADGPGLRLAVAHLVSLGHQRIAYVDGAGAPSTSARRAGYRAAMRSAGLADQCRVVIGGEAEEDGAEAARNLLADGLPTAVITYNDRCAVGLLDVFARHGVAVPGEVSVVGYDDSQVARLPYLHLTTVSQDIPTMAEVAVARLIARIARTVTGRRESVLGPHLVVRGTTGRPPS